MWNDALDGRQCTEEARLGLEAGVEGGRKHPASAPALSHGCMRVTVQGSEERRCRLDRLRFLPSTTTPPPTWGPGAASVGNSEYMILHGVYSKYDVSPVFLKLGMSEPKRRLWESSGMEPGGNRSLDAA